MNNEAMMPRRGRSTLSINAEGGDVKWVICVEYCYYWKERRRNTVVVVTDLLGLVCSTRNTVVWR